MSELRQTFIKSLEENSALFGVRLSAKKIDELAVYYELVMHKDYEFLHLVAPVSSEEFATRHVLESLMLLEFLSEKGSFVDVGTGAGLPSVPCLIARKDLSGILVESKLKKANFLEKVLTECKLEKRAKIINRQFEEIQKPRVPYVLCRALDKFTQKLPRLLKWSGNATLLFFGGNSLREELNKHGVKFDEKLMPLSEQRFLFIVKN